MTTQASSSSSRSRSNLLSIVSPVAYSSSTCGYCTSPGSGQRSTTKSSRSYAVWAYRLSPYHYQRLIDRGWRRSGDYIYKPDLARTCCPQTPIRLDAAAFTPSKRHKRAITNLLFQVRTTKQKPARWKGKWSRGRHWDLENRWSQIEAEAQPQPDAHKDKRKAKDQGDLWADTVAGPKTKQLETTLRLSSSTDEKYQLFRRYQSRIHGEPDDKISARKGWQRFLVDTSMMPVWPSSGRMLTDKEEAAWRSGKVVVPHDELQQVPYGCYHYEYRLDGQLIAVGVLDILPACVSSVYLFYDPDFDHLEIGKVSALREIALTKQLSRKAGMESLRHYYLGFYIHECQKMKYKAEYRPCELLDCATNEWRLYTDVQPLLDKGVRYAFDTPCQVQVLKPQPCDSKSGDAWPCTTEGVDEKSKSDSITASVEHKGSDSENDDDDDEENTRIPIHPFPPPGMLSPCDLLNTLDSSRRSLSSTSSDRNLATLSRALSLNVSRQFEGIVPLLMSTYARTYLESRRKGEEEEGKEGDEGGGGGGGKEDEFVKAVECLAAWGGDEELESGVVLFL